MKLSKINTGQRSRWLIKATCIDRSHYPYRALFHGWRHEAKCLFILIYTTITCFILKRNTVIVKLI